MAGASSPTWRSPLAMYKGRDFSKSVTDKGRDLEDEARQENARGILDILSAIPGIEMAPLKALGVFAGAGAKTANLAKKAIAERRLAHGTDPAKVWREEGWGIGPDGQWRFEIPDNSAKTNLSHQGKSGEISASGDLDKGLNHPELFDAYPELRKKQSAIYEGKNVPEQGSYSRDGPDYHEFYPQLIAQGPNAKSPVLHEVQHGVQRLENFGLGGSPDAMTFNRLKAIQQDLSQQMLRKHDLGEDYAPILRQFESVSDILAQADKGLPQFQAYQRLGGEAEARLTQHRMNLTPDQRAAQYPFDPAYFEKATGVKVDDLIHHFEPTEKRGGLVQLRNQNVR